MSDIAIRRLSLLEARAEASGFRGIGLPELDKAGASMEPLETADTDEQADPFEQGFAAGITEAEARFAAERAHLANLLSAIDAFQPAESEDVMVLIAATVRRLVGDIVGEAAVDGALLNARARRAAAVIAEADAARTLRLHPDDVALIDADCCSLPIIADASLQRGSLRIETNSGWVEDGTSVFFDALDAALGWGARAQ
jgi:flagellar assembly protein FliH